ncbi:MAG: glycosyltransferase family 2 protein [SAR324 cluster bacterium]|nr:glycosyltransferase family 2 protein [SAR324 cluster bacterium]
MIISVLVATYKRPDFLVKCLQALAGQARLPDEVIVIVREEDRETLKRLQELDNPVLNSNLFKVATVSAPGIVHAENRGLELARGEIVALIDDDAIALVDWLQRIEHHYLDPQVGAVGGPTIPYIEGKPVLEMTRERCLSKTWYGRHHGNSEKIPDALREVHVLRGCNMSFRKSLAQAQFDQRLKPYWRRFEDDMILPIHRQRYKVLYDPQVQVYHHTAPVKGVLTRDRDQDTIFGSHHNNTYVMLKHSGGFQKIAFLCFTFLIGDATNPGMAALIAKGIFRKQFFQSFQELTWALRGKISGIQSYRDWLRERQNA